MAETKTMSPSTKDKAQNVMAKQQNQDATKPQHSTNESRVNLDGVKFVTKRSDFKRRNLDPRPYSYAGIDLLNLYKKSKSFRNTVSSGDCYYFQKFVFRGKPSIIKVKSSLIFNGKIVRLPTDVLLKRSGSGGHSIFIPRSLIQQAPGEQAVTLTIRADSRLLSNFLKSGGGETFGQMLTRLMAERSMGVKELASATGISERTIERYRADDYKDRPELYNVVAICIGLHLPYFISEKLIGLAGYKLRNNNIEAAYIFILQLGYQSSVHDCNNFLRYHEYEPLTSL